MSGCKERQALIAARMNGLGDHEVILLADRCDHVNAVFVLIYSMNNVAPQFRVATSSQLSPQYTHRIVTETIMSEKLEDPLKKDAQASRFKGLLQLSFVS